jgi:hypothetical protein
MIRLYGKEDNTVNADIKIVAEILGLYVDAYLYVPIMVKILFEEDTKVSAKLTSNTLEILSCLLSNETQESFKNELPTVIKILGDIENSYK